MAALMLARAFARQGDGTGKALGGPGRAD